MEHHKQTILKYIKFATDGKITWTTYKDKIRKLRQLNGCKYVALDPIVALSYYGEYVLLKTLISHHKIKPNNTHNSALRYAVMFNNVECVDILLNHKSVNPSDCHNDCILSASEHGYFEIVKKLLNYADVNPTDMTYGECAIGISHQQGHLDIYNYLMSHANGDDNIKLLYAVKYDDVHHTEQLINKATQADYLLLFNYAINNSNLHIIKLLMSKHKDVNFIEMLTRDLTSDDLGWMDDEHHLNWDILKYLMFNAHVPLDYSANDDILIIGASHAGHLDIVVELMQQNADPSAQNNAPLYLATLNNRYDIIIELIKDPRANPMGYLVDYSDSSIVIAVILGYIDLVHLYLKDDRCDPHAVIYGAIQSNNIKLIEHMLEHYDVDLCHNNNIFIYLATKYGNIDIVNLILQDVDVDVNDVFHSAIQTSIILDKIDIFRRLIRRTRRNDNILQFACKMNKYKYVKLLLRDYKFNPGLNNQEIIKYFCKYKTTRYSRIFKLLLKHKKVNPSVQKNYCIKWASFNGHLEYINLLLKHPKVTPMLHHRCNVDWAVMHNDVFMLMLNNIRHRENIGEPLLSKYFNNRSCNDKQIMCILNNYIIDDLSDIIISYEP